MKTAKIRRTRDDFSMRVKRSVSSRVSLICSNPGCRAVTAGPRSDPDGTINIGVAAHISAAATGGPRYNPLLKPEDRKKANNAIWLCQNCAKLVDNDPAEFTEGLLLKWKRDAELEARRQLGKKRATQKSSNATAVKKKLALRRRLERDLKHLRRSEVIIHSDEDNEYPDFWDRPGISNWFKVEFWGIYHNGIEVALSIEIVLIARDGRWAFVPFRKQPEVRNGIKVYEIGRIPFRNIIDYNVEGDEYYPIPHIYCHFADEGQPYESIEAELVDSRYPRRLDTKRKVKFEEIVGEIVS